MVKLPPVIIIVNIAQCHVWGVRANWSRTIRDVEVLNAVMAVAVVSLGSLSFESKAVVAAVVYLGNWNALMNECSLQLRHAMARSSAVKLGTRD